MKLRKVKKMHNGRYRPCMLSVYVRTDTTPWRRVHATRLIRGRPDTSILFYRPEAPTWSWHPLMETGVAAIPYEPQ